MNFVHHNIQKNQTQYSIVRQLGPLPVHLSTGAINGRVCQYLNNSVEPCYAYDCCCV